MPAHDLTTGRVDDHLDAIGQVVEIIGDADDGRYAQFNGGDRGGAVEVAFSGDDAAGALEQSATTFGFEVGSVSSQSTQ